MTPLVDHLAELTGFRDRDALEVTLASVLKDLIPSRAVAIYRSVGEEGSQRWLTRARLATGDIVAASDPIWIDPSTLAPLEAHPAPLAAFTSQTLVVQPGATQLTVFPLSTDREVLGVLEFESDAVLDEMQVRLVASVLRIYRNFQALLDYSERDTLTGLLNRKTFDDSFLKATAEPRPVPSPHRDARRGDGPRGGYWLGVIDIDHFKRVNDNFGHLIGDEVLLLLARLMRGSFRHYDRLYRFGGEEFVVMMRCDTADESALAFERFRHNTEQHAFPQVGHITVSVGFSEVRQDDTPSGAFERADKAVYHAKQHGRNQVCSHAALVASGLLVEAKNIGDVELF